MWKVSFKFIEIIFYINNWKLLNQIGRYICRMYEYIRYPVFMLSKSVKNLISVGGVENICHQLTPICLNFKVQVEYKSSI